MHCSYNSLLFLRGDGHIEFIVQCTKILKCSNHCVPSHDTMIPHWLCCSVTCFPLVLFKVMPCVEVGWCSVASIAWTHPSFASAPCQGWSRSFWHRASSWLEHLRNFLGRYLENNTPETGCRNFPLPSEVQLCIWYLRPLCGDLAWAERGAGSLDALKWILDIAETV